MKIFFAGGLNEQQTPNIHECGSGYNFDLGLKQTKLIPRAPFDLKGTATNASAINGFMQLVKRDNTETTLLQAGDTVYQWNGTTTFTSKGTVATAARLRDTYWSLGDYLVITDIALADVVKKWDGTTFGNLTTGLGTSLYAKYGAVHLGRVWLANVTASSATPHLILASAYENPQSYDTSLRGGPSVLGGGSFTTGQEAFYLLSPDLKPINGMVVFYGQLIISTVDGKLYRLTGTSGSTFQWVDYYAGSSAVGTESMSNIGDDVIYMKKGGGIDLLSSTAESGDVATDDISRYILTTVANLTGAKVVYDQTNQKIFFFIADKILVLFKDLINGELSPWSVYTTADSSGFNTNGAKYMKIPGTQNYSVFWGDSTGRVFDMNGTRGGGDAGATSIAVLRKTRFIYDGEGGDQQGRGKLDLKQRILHGKIQYRRVATSADVTLSFDWGDEYNISTSTITLKGAPTVSQALYFSGTSIAAGAAYYGGTFYYSQGLGFAQKISSQTFSPTGKGPGFFLSTSLDTKTDFQIDDIELE